MASVSNTSYMSLVMLVILSGVITYLVFMFKNGWYAQTVLGLAVIGGLIATIFGIRRITSPAADDLVGAILLLGGILILLAAGIAIQKLFRRDKTIRT